MHMLTRPDCDCAFNHSKSQYAEDLIMLPTLLHARRGSPGHGVFVELGALDGIAFSNTYMLEACFNWTGALIEGHPANFDQLLKSRRAPASCAARDFFFLPEDELSTSASICSTCCASWLTQSFSQSRTSDFSFSRGSILAAAASPSFEKALVLVSRLFFSSCSFSCSCCCS